MISVEDVKFDDDDDDDDCETDTCSETEDSRSNYFEQNDDCIQILDETNFNTNNNNNNTKSSKLFKKKKWLNFLELIKKLINEQLIMSS